MLWLAILLGAIAGLVIALFVLPFGVKVAAASGPQRYVRTQVRPCAPLCPWIALPAPSAQPQAAPGEPRSKQVARRRPNPVRLFRAAIGELRHLLRKIDIQRFSLQGCIGFANPADTGRLYGLYAAARPTLPQGFDKHVALTFNFGDAELRGALEVEASLRPMVLIVPAWRVIRAMAQT